MGHGGQPGTGGFERVHAHHIELGVMGSGAEPLDRRFVERRPEDPRLGAEELDPVGPLFLHPLHPAAGGVGVRHRFLAVPAEDHERLDARGRDFVVPRPLLVMDEPAGVEVAEVAARGDPVAHPELVDVLGRDPLPRALVVLMEVHVDESGQDVVSFEIDLVVPRFRLRTILLPDRGHSGAHVVDRVDDVALDDDVHRAVGRRAGAVDHDGPAQDQPVPGSFPVGAVGHRIRQVLLSHQGRGHGAGDEQGENQAWQTVSRHSAGASGSRAVSHMQPVEPRGIPQPVRRSRRRRCRSSKSLRDTTRTAASTPKPVPAAMSSRIRIW